MSTIYLVGAGPGRPDLLTLRAAEVLRLAGAVLYDRLVSPEILALAPPTAELFPVGKEHGRQEEIQNEIHALLEQCAARHPHVVRLKGGDPMVFGRGAEEWLYLTSRGYDVELVPGVSAAISVPSLAGIPLTLRGVSGAFAVVAGHRATGAQEWARYAHVETLVILMGVLHRAEIARTLIELGRAPETPVAFIENGSTPRERTLFSRLDQVHTIDVQAPAVMVVGPTVDHRLPLSR